MDQAGAWRVRAPSLLTPMLKEFREFAFKGNMIDLAVGMILGAAFGTVVTSLVSDVIMPVFGIIGTKDFSNLYLPLKGQDLNLTLDLAREKGPVIAYGLFLNKFISFLVISFVIFLIVKKVMQAFLKEKREALAAAPALSREEVLLAEIRDLLKQRS